jgi:arylsulfatase A-like enzyme
VTQGAGTIRAVVAGSLLVSAFETAHALARGWDHAPGYFVLSLAATVLLGVVLAAPGAALARLRPWTVALWAAVAVGIAGHGRDALPALAALLLVRWLLGLGAAGAGIEALVAAGAVAVGLVQVAPHPALQRLAGEAAAPALGFALALVALGLLARALARLPRAACAAALVLVVLASAAYTPPARTPAAPATPAPPAAGPARAGDPSIAVIVLDTVGTRHLSLYGYERRTSPELERVVRSRPNAVVYPAAWSNSPWTGPSHASLVTGVIPSRHGAHEGRFVQDGSGIVALEAELTLPEALRARGYRTLALFANRLDLVGGVSRGFDVFRQIPYPERLPLVGEKLRKNVLPGAYAESRKPYPEAARVTRGVLEGIGDCSVRPCFLLVNYLDAHAPYIPERACRGRFGAAWSLREDVEGPSIRDGAARLEQLRARHDEEICGLDLALGELLDGLAARGWFERGWVFVTSDHGEAFGEHGAVEHGSSIYDEQTRIPLVAFPPDGVHAPRIEEPVSLVDVTATVAALAGAGPLGEGHSLLSSAPARRAQIEFFGWPEFARRKGALTALPAAAVVVGTHKLVSIDGKLELYELGSDPHELADLAGSAGERTSALARALPPLDRALAAAAAGTGLSARDRESLRALGYVE